MTDLWGDYLQDKLKNRTSSNATVEVTDPTMAHVNECSTAMHKLGFPHTAEAIQRVFDLSDEYSAGTDEAKIVNRCERGTNADTATDQFKQMRRM